MIVVGTQKRQLRKRPIRAVGGCDNPGYMEIGERVRVIKVPDGLQDGPELKTKMLFERCLGEIFPVMGFDGDLLALDVGEINGLAPYLETIYIEPSCVEIVVEK